MNVDLMRAIDRHFGVPLCFLLTLARRPLALLPRKDLPRPRRILFIELSEMGSTILADPAMRKARRQFEAELFFVIFARNRESLDLLATVPAENVFTLRESNLARLAVDTCRFLLWCRQRRIDTVVDLELFSRFTALLTGLSGAANRLGFHPFFNEGLYRGSLLTHRVAYNPHLHISKNFVALINGLASGPAELPLSKTRVTDEETQLQRPTFAPAALDAMRARIAKEVPGYEARAHRLLLVNPNASELLVQRRWMPERYVELIRRLLGEYEDLHILLTGAPSERAEAEVMRAQVNHPRCHNLAGLLRLGELPLLYAVSSCLVTNDSGPGHFAAVTTLPTVVLFGPETPSLYAPLGNTHCLFAGLACSPCVSAANHRKTACRDNACMRAISVDEVHALLRRLLGQG